MSPAPMELRQSGSRLVDRLRNYYVNGSQPAPVISEQSAFLVAALFTLFYVAPFYLSPILRTSAVTSRDAPSVIRARVRAVGLTCLVCIIVAVYFLAIYGQAGPIEVLRLTGIWPVNPSDVLKVLALTMVLFTCSLFEMLIVDGDWRQWGFIAWKEGVWDSWTGYRNLIVAPISEELVFRALTIPLFILAKTPPTRIVFVTPLIFGLAHLHHLYAFLQSRTPPDQRFPSVSVWINGVIASIFQFAYTSLFGFFAAFVFLRTGNIWAVIVAHSFCNKMGLPRLWGRVGQYENQLPLKPTSPDVAQGKREDDGTVSSESLIQSDDGLTKNRQDRSIEFPPFFQSPSNLGIGWSVAYYALIIVGAYGFYDLLFPLTESTNALVKF